MTPCTIPTSSGIYRIVCEANGKVYVGSAVNLRGRWKLHLSALAAGKHHNAHLQAAWNKYGGLGAFRFETVELVPEELLLDAEQRHIDGCRNKFNIRLEASSNRGIKPSEQTKAKMRAAAMGKSVSAETRARMSVAQRGRVMSQEAIEKSRAANTGRLQSAETRARISAANRGRVMSAETRKNMSAGQRGRVASVETRAKMRAAHLGMIASPATRKKMSIWQQHRPAASPASRAKMRASAALRWEAVRAAAGASI